MIAGIRSFSRGLAVCLLLGVYALLPAAAWIHERLEHLEQQAVTACSHETGDHPSEPSHQHHNGSHCQICQMIHACGKQAILPASTPLIQLRPLVTVAAGASVESPCIFFVAPRSSRAPPKV